jgi:ribonuclease HII
MDFTAEYIVKGDATVWAIGAASIIAKVHRDDYMAGVPSTTHPVYGWADNAGYGTANHIAAIRAHGLTPMHRASFCRAFVPGGVVAKEATMDSASNIIEDLFG